MKRLTKLVLLPFLTFMLTGCHLLGGAPRDNTPSGGGGNTPGGQHVHTYSSTYSYDDNYHWRAATCEHTELTMDLGPHRMSGKWVVEVPVEPDKPGLLSQKCSVCDHKIFEEIDPAEYANRTFAFRLNDDGISYSVCLANPSMAPRTVIIPDTYNNLPVNTIMDNGFANSDIEYVTMPDSIIVIGHEAFNNCQNLKEVHFSNNLESYGDFAFNNCVSLSSVAIPGKVEYISAWCFQSCTSLLEVYMGDHVDYIQSGAFLGCVNLQNLNLSHNLHYIDSEAFAYCRCLQGVTLPDNLEGISSRAFAECTSLNGISFPDSMYYISDEAFINCESLQSITISKNINYIGEGAFCGCNKIESLVFNTTVNIEIGPRAFEGCVGLKNVILPNTLTSIDATSFKLCSSLAFTNFNAGKYLSNGLNPYFALLTGLSAVHSNTEIIASLAFAGSSYITSLVIPSKVRSIGTKAFYGCSKLQSVSVVSSELKVLGYQAFAECPALTNAVIEANPNYRCETALFYDCTSLVNATLKLGNECLGDEMFYNCYNLEKVTADDNLYIGYHAFYNCTKFQGFDNNPTIYNAGDESFYNCSSLSNIDLSNVSQIGYKAFYGCSNLTSITIGVNCYEIYEYAFQYCSNLSDVNFLGTKTDWTSRFRFNTTMFKNTKVTVVHCTDGDVKV